MAALGFTLKMEPSTHRALIQGGHAKLRLFVSPLSETITSLLAGRSSKIRRSRKAKNRAHILRGVFGGFSQAERSHGATKSSDFSPGRLTEFAARSRYYIRFSTASVNWHQFPEVSLCFKPCEFDSHRKKGLPRPKCT